MSVKKLLARTNRFLEPLPPHTVTSSHFWGGKDDLQTEQHVAGEFLASNFLDKNKSRQQREFVFGSSISPPEKARIFSYKKMYSNISLLSTWVALAGNRHKTPRDSSSTAKRHLLTSGENRDRIKSNEFHLSSPLCHVWNPGQNLLVAWTSSIYNNFKLVCLPIILDNPPVY